jgi:O-acetylserine/cysteine efflux transporter
LSGILSLRETMSAMSVNVATEPPRGAYSLGTLYSQFTLVFAAACLAVALFALVPASTRIAGLQLDGLSIGLIRAVGAGLLTAPLLLVCRLRPPQKAKDLALLLVYAVGNFAGFPILFSLGTQRTSGSHAALIMATMPLLVGLIGICLDRRLPRSSWFVGAAIAVVGEVALVGFGNVGTAAGATIAGDAIVLAGCALSAVGLVAGARLGSRMNPLGAAFWAMTIASAGLVPFAAIHLMAAPYRFEDLTGMTWTAIVHITLGAAVLANVALVWALSRGGLVRVAPIQFAQPVCALFFTSALLNERLTPSLLFVAAAIVFGIVTASRGARPSKTITDPARTVAESVRSVARFLSPLFCEQEHRHKPSDCEPYELDLSVGRNPRAQALVEEPA